MRDYEKKEGFKLNYSLITILIVIGMIGIIAWSLQNKIDKLEDSFSYINNKIDRTSQIKVINEIADEVERLRTKVNRLENENIELWFSRIDPETKEKIVTDYNSFGCKWSDKGVQNTYFGLLVPRDYGYLRYTSSEGVVLFNDVGDAFCFDTNQDLVICTKLCAEEISEETIIEIAEEFENGK